MKYVLKLNILYVHVYILCVCSDYKLRDIFELFKYLPIFIVKCRYH